MTLGSSQSGGPSPLQKLGFCTELFSLFGLSFCVRIVYENVLMSGSYEKLIFFDIVRVGCQLCVGGVA